MLLVAALAVAVAALALPACSTFSSSEDPTTAGGDGATGTDATSAVADVVADVATRDAGDSGCGDILASASNCGACGHACTDAGCKAGLCQDTVLVTSQVANPGSIALAGTGGGAVLAWTNAPAQPLICPVTSCSGTFPKPGTYPVDELAWASDGATNRLFGFTLPVNSGNSNSCLWTNAGCMSATVFNEAIAGVAGQGVSAYFLKGSGGPWTIERYNLNAGLSAELATGIPLQPRLLSVALGEGRIAFATSAGIHLFAPGQSPVPFTDAWRVDNHAPTLLVIDPNGDAVLWYDGTTVWESKPGGMPPRAVYPDATLTGMVATTDAVYATTSVRAEALVRIDRVTQKRLVLARADDPGVSLAVDVPGRVAYWMAGTKSGGKIYATPIP